MYVRGIPALTAALAPLVPVAWKERLGAAVVKHLMPAQRYCDAPEQLTAVRQIIARLAASAAPQPYTFRVHIADSPMVNALAAPGGHIVLFNGILHQTRTPEELAGVLAHEMQHVLQRHSTRTPLHYFSTGLLIPSQRETLAASPRSESRAPRC